MHLAHGTLFPSRQIFLSNYAMILLCNRLLKDNDSFKEDISAPLFTRSKKIQTSNFNSEMRAAFAGYFFAFNGTDIEDITKAVWDWIRGICLKNSYNNTMKDLSFTLRRFMGEKFNYHKFEEFKQRYILNVLFSNNFIDKYENFLKSCGYKIQSDKNDTLKWRNGKKVAPKYPGAFFAPHIEFLLTWTIYAFSDFANEKLLDFSGKNKIKFLETLAQNFFRSVHDGYIDSTNKTNINLNPIFINQHSSEARKSSKEIKYGKGKTITNKLTGEKSKESPGALEFYIKEHLFSFDDEWCLDVRKQKEEELLLLHNKYKETRNPELIKSIFKIEDDIRQENESIYGINLDAFINIPEVLTPGGEFIPRKNAGNIEYIETTPSEKSDIKVSSSMKLQYDLFADLSPEFIFQGLHATRQTNENFHRFSSNGNGWAHDNNGIYECINEFIQEKPGDLWKTQKNEVSKTGRTRLNCKLKYMLFEWDHLPLISQWQKVQENISLICQATYSGNKSIHIKIAAKDEPKNIEEYDWLREHILIELGFVDSDPNIKDNSRTSRFPGSINPKTGRIQQLLHYNPGAYFIKNWRPLFVAEKTKKAAIKTNFTVPYDNNKLKEYWIKRIVEMRGSLEEGNQTYLLPTIINTLSCSVLSIEELESLLKDYLTKDHHRDIASLYKYRRQRM